MRSFRKNLSHVAVAAAGAASLSLVGATAASAQPATSVSPTSGTSATNPIQITIPSNATCSGDDTGGANQYQIFPYIIPASESPASIRYTGGAITTLAWFTDDTADTFGQFVPGVGNHSVSQPAHLDWSPYQTNSDYGVSGADLQPGTYNVGLICIDIGGAPNNPTGAPDIPGNGDPTQDGQENFWNTQFTFTTSGSTSAGPDFTWTATVGTGNQTPEAPLAIALPLSFLGLAGAGALVLRRRRHRTPVTA